MEVLNESYIQGKLAKPDESIIEHTQALLDCMEELVRLGYIQQDNEIQKLKSSILHHDIGKSDALFQSRLEQGGYFNPNKEVPHNILSFFLMKDEDLEASYAVLEHHHHGDNFAFYSAKASENQRSLLLQRLTELLGEEDAKNQLDSRDDILSDILDDLYDTPLPYTKILGLLNKCDYAASAHLDVELPPDFLVQKLDNMMARWQEKNPEAKWNDLQRYCIANRDKNLIVIAPTGMGKTEAGLQWIGDSKGFFILPLRTAINAIYKRVKEEILLDEDVDRRLALLHSDTMQIYLQNAEQTQELDVQSYFELSKNFAMPLSISTPDQLFDFVFAGKGHELKKAMLSYSKVVIDEIQAYSPDLLAVLIRGIQDIVDMGGQVAIFTATMPPFIMDLLELEMDSNYFGNDIRMVKNPKYKFLFQSFPSEQLRHNVEVADEKLTAEAILAHYQGNQGQQKKYLVVCNTIKKAQALYSELKAQNLSNLNIFHSKYTKVERAELENKILAVGKTECIADEIWISTQVVEASLDIDFDVLFTELSDLNSLFQRFGRINRKGKKSAEEANCFVFTEIDSNLFIDGKKGFIDPCIFKLSRNAIRSKRGKLSEEDKQTLIAEYLKTENILDSNFYKTYKEEYKYLCNCRNYKLDLDAKKRLRNIISYSVFPVDKEKGLINKKEIYELHEKLKDIQTELKTLSSSKREAKKNKLEISPEQEQRYQELLLCQHKVISKLMEYTVSVGLFDVKYVKDRLSLSKRNSIPMVYCHYDEMGFRRLSSKEAEGLSLKESAKVSEEESFDSFL